MATTKLEDVLAFVPVFRGLTKRQLKHLASLMDVADYMADAAIVREGTKGDAFYVVLKGQATVTMNDHFLSRLVPGDHFGEIAAIDGGVRSATVTSETPVQLARDAEEVPLEGAPRRPRTRALTHGRALPHDPPGEPGTVRVAAPAGLLPRSAG